MPIVISQHLREGRFVSMREALVKRPRDVGEQSIHIETDAADLERVERHVRSFVAEAERVGAATELSQRMFVRTGLVAVQFSIDEVFDQTPGPTAGRRL